MELRVRELLSLFPLLRGSMFGHFGVKLSYIQPPRGRKLRTEQHSRCAALQQGLIRLSVARAAGPETSTWGVKKDMAPFASRACLARLSVSPTLLLQSAPTLHGPSGPTQCRTCQTKHSFPCGDGAIPTTCTQNAHTHRRAARPQAAHILNGSLHTSGRSCASNEGCTETLPDPPLWEARGERGSGGNIRCSSAA